MSKGKSEFEHFAQRRLSQILIHLNIGISVVSTVICLTKVYFGPNLVSEWKKSLGLLSIYL